jgi:hypothetical protein
MSTTDRIHDVLANLGVSPGEVDPSAPAVPAEQDLFGADGGIAGTALAETLLEFDGETPGADSPGGELAGLSEATDSFGEAENDEFAGLLQEDEAPFDFSGREFSVPSGPTIRMVGDFSDGATFDPAAAIRQSLWYDDATTVSWAADAAAEKPGMLGESDLLFLDSTPYAKGGNGGGGKGGGGGGGDTGDTGGTGGEPVLSNYVSGDLGGYNIEIVFKKGWTADLQTAFIDSAEMISDLITGDISDVFFRGGVIDDIRIDAELKAIDGDGGILGQAGPTAIRTSNYLPATAVMQFDIADAQTFDALGLWDGIVFHEMMHSIGFGSVWGYLGLVDGAGTDSPIFTGAAATYTYQRDFDEVTDLGVPVEQDGGAGTRDSHWDEETFDNEIMTGYINMANYLSEMTVASLDDLGYETVWNEDFYLT